jgi:hypothetical protein
LLPLGITVAVHEVWLVVTTFFPAASVVLSAQLTFGTVGLATAVFTVQVPAPPVVGVCADAS